MDALRTIKFLLEVFEARLASVAEDDSCIDYYRGLVDAYKISLQLLQKL